MRVFLRQAGLGRWMDVESGAADVGGIGVPGINAECVTDEFGAFEFRVPVGSESWVEVLDRETLNGGAIAPISARRADGKLKFEFAREVSGRVVLPGDVDPEDVGVTLVTNGKLIAGVPALFVRSDLWPGYPMHVWGAQDPERAEVDVGMLCPPRPVSVGQSAPWIWFREAAVEDDGSYSIPGVLLDVGAVLEVRIPGEVTKRFPVSSSEIRAGVLSERVIERGSFSLEVSDERSTALPGGSFPIVRAFSGGAVMHVPRTPREEESRSYLFELPSTSTYEVELRASVPDGTPGSEWGWAFVGAYRFNLGEEGPSAIRWRDGGIRVID